MTLVKDTLAQPRFIETGKTKMNNKRALMNEVDRLSTPSILWFVIKRHKLGILATGNIILVLNWVIPSWFTMLVSLVQSINL